MIQKMTVNDIRVCVELAEKYHKEHWFGKHTKYDADYIFANFRQFIVNPMVNMLVAYDDNKNIVGFSVCFMQPLLWSKQLRATINFSYLEPDHRKSGKFNAMVQSHIEWAKQNNCVDINIGDGAEHNGKFGILARQMNFDNVGTDAYMVLNYDKKD
jgi:hypothetical protein